MSEMEAWEEAQGAFRVAGGALEQALRLADDLPEYAEKWCAVAMDEIERGKQALMTAYLSQVSA